MTVYGEQRGTGGYNCSRIGSDGCRGVVNGTTYPVQNVGLGGILQSCGKVQSIYASIDTRGVLNEVGSLTVDLNRQIPVRVSIGEKSSVSSSTCTSDGTQGGSNNIGGTASKHNCVVDVRGIYGTGSQEHVVQRVLRVYSSVVGGSNHVDFSPVVRGKVITYASTSQTNLLNRQGYRPELISAELKNTNVCCGYSVNGVLTVIQESNLNAIGDNIGGFADGRLSRLAKHNSLVGQFIVGNIITRPLVDNVVNQVLETSRQIGSSLMGDVILILVDIGHKEGTGVGQGHPLEAIARAMSSSSSTHESTTGSVKLSVSGRGNQVTLILLTVKSS